jgi:hypothetical protein
MMQWNLLHAFFPLLTVFPNSMIYIKYPKRLTNLPIVNMTTPAIPYHCQVFGFAMVMGFSGHLQLVTTSNNNLQI